MTDLPDDAAWGSGSGLPVGEGDTISGWPMDVGHGHFIKLDPDVFKQMLREQYVIDAIRERGRRVAELANSLAGIEGSVYTYIYMDTPGFTRPQCLVIPANYKAKVDDRAHSTLMIAAAMVGSDPKIEEGDFHILTSEEQEGLRPDLAAPAEDAEELDLIARGILGVEGE